MEDLSDAARKIAVLETQLQNLTERFREHRKDSDDRARTHDQRMWAVIGLVLLAVARAILESIGLVL